MSFVSILFFACLFYLGNGKPQDRNPMVLQAIETIETADFTEEFDVAVLEHELGLFIGEIGNSVEKHLMPLISGLDQEDQNEIFEIGMEGFLYYIDYILELVRFHVSDEEVFSEEDQASIIKRVIIRQYGGSEE